MSYVVCQMWEGRMVHGWVVPRNQPGDPCFCGAKRREPDKQGDNGEWRQRRPLRGHTPREASA